MAAYNGILLESGTNELEFGEFSVNGMHCGVNVAKVREIIKKPELSSIVGSPQAVAGMMTLRNKVLPIIDLAQILGKHSDDEATRIVVLEFNKGVTGALVNSVSRIYRISWENVEAPSTTVDGSYVTGLVKMEDRIILILDFERILAELFQEGAVKSLDAQSLLSYDGTSKKILVVDDSTFIRSQISSTLRGASYTVEEAANGEEAWNYIDRTLADGSFDIDAIITDVEMPKMDGLHLVTLIRGKEALSKLPVYV